MKKIRYSGYRFPPKIIQQAIWLYPRFTLSLCDVEDLLAERGIAVSYESIRRWINHFGPTFVTNPSSSLFPKGFSAGSRRFCRQATGVCAASAYLLVERI
jgi:hypothetical protein